MKPDVRLDLLSLCHFAGWKDWLDHVSDEVVSVRETGEVVFEHRGIDFSLGTLTPAQLAALSAWYGSRPSVSEIEVGD